MAREVDRKLGGWEPTKLKAEERPREVWLSAQWRPLAAETRAVSGKCLGPESNGSGLGKRGEELEEDQDGPQRHVPWALPAAGSAPRGPAEAPRLGHSWGTCCHIRAGLFKWQQRHLMAPAAVRGPSSERQTRVTPREPGSAGDWRGPLPCQALRGALAGAAVLLGPTEI